MENLLNEIDLQTLIQNILILASCACLAGFCAGLLGIGGGIIFVPVLYFVFMTALHVDADTAMILATGTSLFCMIPTSISAAISQYKKGNLSTDIVKTWAFGLCLGVILGSTIASRYGGKWISALFGSIMIINSLNTLFRANAKPLFDKLPSKFAQNVIAFFISLFSVMLGIGGGTLTIPVLNAHSVNPRQAIGTSSAVSLFVAIPGALILLFTSSTPINAPFATMGHINFLAALCIIPLSVLFAPFGVKFGKSISPITLKRIFAISLFIISIKMLMSSF